MIFVACEKYGFVLGKSDGIVKKFETSETYSTGTNLRTIRRKVYDKNARLKQ